MRNSWGKKLASKLVSQAPLKLYQFWAGNLLQSE